MRYSAVVLARARDRKHAGWLPRDAPDVGTGEAGSMQGGTLTRVQVRVGANRVIDTAVFKVFGDEAAIASASLVTERLHGLAVDAVTSMEPIAVVAELQLPMERAGVASLAVSAAQLAVDDWKRKQDALER